MLAARDLGDAVEARVTFTVGGIARDGARVERSAIVPVRVAIAAEEDASGTAVLERRLAERAVERRESRPRFRDATAEAGLGAERNDPDVSVVNHLIEGIWPGSGVAVLDIDGRRARGPLRRRRPVVDPLPERRLRPLHERDGGRRARRRPGDRRPRLRLRRRRLRRSLRDRQFRADAPLPQPRRRDVRGRHGERRRPERRSGAAARRPPTWTGTGRSISSSARRGTTSGRCPTLPSTRATAGRTGSTSTTATAPSRRRRRASASPRRAGR